MPEYGAQVIKEGEVIGTVTSPASPGVRRHRPGQPEDRLRSQRDQRRGSHREERQQARRATGSPARSSSDLSIHDPEKKKPRS